MLFEKIRKKRIGKKCLNQNTENYSKIKNLKKNYYNFIKLVLFIEFLKKFILKL